MRVACLFFTHEVHLLHVAEACYQFSPMLAARSPNTIFIEIGACKKLYSEHSLTKRIHALIKRFNTRARFSIGDSAPESLARARLNLNNRPLLDMPLKALLDVANPFQFDALRFKETEKIIFILERLGLRYLKDFKKLPIENITARFGQLGLKLHHRLNNPEAIVWPTFKRPDFIAETFELPEDNYCDTLEPLLFPIRSLVDRSMARLRGRGERATQICLTLLQEKYKHTKNNERRVTCSFHHPQGGSLAVMSALHDKLQHDLTKTPLSAPVEKITAEITETVKGRMSQRHFFHRKEEEEEKWAELANQLWGKLGQKRVFWAHVNERYLPECAWHKHPDPEKKEKTILPFSLRPLRLLPKPQEMKRLEHWLIYRDNRWRIVEWQGPERVSGEWWFHEFQRDYYRIFTDTQQQLWIFFNTQGQCFLHGYFD